MRLIEFPEGRTIFSEGAPSQYCYEIVTGAVEIRLNRRSVASSPRQILVSRLGPGEVFGEMAVIDHGPRSASAVATEATTCKALTGDEIMAILETDPGEAMKFLKIIIHRLRDATVRIAQFDGMDAAPPPDPPDR